MVSRYREVARALDPAVVFKDAFGYAPMAHQVEFVRETRPVIVLKGRQTGFTQGAAALCLHKAVYFPGSTSVIISPTQRQSSEAMLRARNGLAGLGVTPRQESATMLALANTSRVISLPGSARTARGWSVDGVLILDEAAFLDDQTLAVARATTAVGGRIVILSTPAGETGTFHDLWHDTPAGWAKQRVPTADAHTVSAAFLDQERRTLPPDVFATEYECAFGRAGRGLFTAEEVAALATTESKYAPFGALKEKLR